MAVQVGKTYDVNHSRKGRFRLKVLGINGEWITGQMVSGKTKTLLPENSAEAGETVTVREQLATFTEVPADG